MSHYILCVSFGSLLSAIVHLFASDKCMQKYAHCIVLCCLCTSGLYNRPQWQTERKLLVCRLLKEVDFYVMSTEFRELTQELFSCISSHAFWSPIVSTIIDEFITNFSIVSTLELELDL